MWGINSTDTGSEGSLNVLEKLFGKNESEDRTPTVRSLDSNGYEVYNVGTGPEANIYVSKPSTRAYFDDDEEFGPTITQISDDVAIISHEEVAVEEPADPVIQYDDPAEVFVNAIKRPVYEDIDFNEVIVKKKPSVLETVAPLEGVVEKDDMLSAYPNAVGVAVTSSASEPVRCVRLTEARYSVEDEADLMPFFVPQLSEDFQYFE